jgi:hypothetical protein
MRCAGVVAFCLSHNRILLLYYCMCCRGTMWVYRCLTCFELAMEHPFNFLHCIQRIWSLLANKIYRCCSDGDPSCILEIGKIRTRYNKGRLQEGGSGQDVSTKPPFGCLCGGWAAATATGNQAAASSRTAAAASRKQPSGCFQPSRTVCKKPLYVQAFTAIIMKVFMPNSLVAPSFQNVLINIYNTSNK